MTKIKELQWYDNGNYSVYTSDFIPFEVYYQIDICDNFYVVNRSVVCLGYEEKIGSSMDFFDCVRMAQSDFEKNIMQCVEE